MRRQDRPRNRGAGLRRLRIGFDQGGKIRARIAEQIVDATIGQQGKIGAGNAAGLLLLSGSAARLWRWSHRGELLYGGKV